MKRIVLVASIGVVCLGVILRGYCIDRFYPEKRIHFTMYTPGGEKRRTQLVLTHYLSLLPWDERDVTLLFDDSRSDTKLITERKADGAIECTKASCETKKTPKGQEYLYAASIDGDDRDEEVRFLKEGTNILVERSTYIDRAMTEEDWSEYIDSFEILPRSDLSLFYIGEEGAAFGG